MMWLWLGRRSEGDQARGALRNSTAHSSPGALEPLEQPWKADVVVVGGWMVEGCGGARRALGS